MSNRLRNTFLLSLLTVLMVLIGNAIGGPGGMLLAFLMALGMYLFSYWFLDRIILARYAAREIGKSDHPACYGMIRRLALRAGRLFITPSVNPSTIATGRNPEHAAVAATAGILLILSPELEGVIPERRPVMKGTSKGLGSRVRDRIRQWLDVVLPLLVPPPAPVPVPVRDKRRPL
jgi:Zn-dependent protease with chaperone function